MCIGRVYPAEYKTRWDVYYGQLNSLLVHYPKGHENTFVDIAHKHQKRVQCIQHPYVLSQYEYPQKSAHHTATPNLNSIFNKQKRFSSVPLIVYVQQLNMYRVVYVLYTRSGIELERDN